MGIKRLVTIILITMLILCNMTISNADTSYVEIETIESTKYKEVPNVTAREVVCYARTGKLMLLVTDNLDIVVDKTYGDRQDGQYESGNSIYYIENHNKLYYTSNGVDYGKTDIEAVVKRMYSLNKDNIVSINSIEEKDNIFYICGLIKKKNKTKQSWDYTTILLKTTDGKNFEKINVPAITPTAGDEVKIYQYKGTYIIAGAHDYSQEKNHYYYYYTSTDLKKWTKRIIKEPWEYDNEVIGLGSITAAGLTFERGYLGWYNSVDVTSDFKNYKTVNEDNVIAGEVDLAGISIDPEVLSDKRVRNNVFSDTQPYFMISVSNVDYGGEFEHILNNRGSDIYISSPYPNKYRKLCSIGRTSTGFRIIQGAEDDGTWKEEWPICIFSSNALDSGKTELKVWDTYKSKRYRTYLIDNLYQINLGTPFHGNNGFMGITYGDELLLTADKYKSVCKMKLPVKFEGSTYIDDINLEAITFKNKVLIIGYNTSIVMDMNDLYNAAKSAKTMIDTGIGDIDGDGKINTKDARAVLLHYIGKQKLSSDQLTAADVNKDGKINTKDARLILLYYIGKLKKL